MSTKYESLKRQWFALHMGELVALGDCGDFEAASLLVCDQFGDESECEWIADYQTVSQWKSVIQHVESRFD